MLHVNERYVDETRDEKGNVVDYQYKYPENFNFAYDVVDATPKLSRAAGR